LVLKHKNEESVRYEHHTNCDDRQVYVLFMQKPLGLRALMLDEKISILSAFLKQSLVCLVHSLSH